MIPVLYYLVGLPASGKSTYAKELLSCSENIILISSDEMRKELYGDENNQNNNGELFQIINKKVKENLKKGIDVIYDATNINSKRRISFLNELNKINCYKKCIYFSSTYDHCVYKDKHRTRTVGENVIKRMYYSLQIPMYFEGWDDIKIMPDDKIVSNMNNSIDFNINSYKEYEILFNNYRELEYCLDLSQDNPYHSLSVSRHMYYAYDWIKQYTDNKYLRIATMLHDIGKPETKAFKDRYAHFYGHENVSAQLCIHLLKTHDNLNDKEIIKIATYIQLHMMLLNFKDNIKSKDIFYDKVGEGLNKDLELLHNADVQAK